MERCPALKNIKKRMERYGKSEEHAKAAAPARTRAGNGAHLRERAIGDGGSGKESQSQENPGNQPEEEDCDFGERQDPPD